MKNTQQHEKLCEKILAEMRPGIRAYHTGKWIQTRKRKILPPKGELELYRLYLARKQ